MALEAGDIAVIDFPGVTGIKRRPAIVGLDRRLPYAPSRRYREPPHDPYCVCNGSHRLPTSGLGSGWATSSIGRPLFVATLSAANVTATGHSRTATGRKCRPG